MKQLGIIILLCLTALGIAAICQCMSDRELEKQQQEQQAYYDARWQEECKQAELEAKAQYTKDSIECKGDLLKMSEKLLEEAQAQDKASASGNIGHKAFNNI